MKYQHQHTCMFVNVNINTNTFINMYYNFSIYIKDVF
jgi:hypothetical protein